MKIPVTCDSKMRLERIPIEELMRFQGALKTLSEENYERCKDSLQSHGFSFPVFYWQDPETGQCQIIDGHQRLAVIEKEGWFVEGEIPVVDIEAKNRSEAAQKLLALNSNYGHIDRDGLYEYFHLMELDAEIELPKYDLPGIENSHFIDEYISDLPTEEEEEERTQSVVPTTCPSCAHQFKVYARNGGVV